MLTLAATTFRKSFLKLKTKKANQERISGSALNLVLTSLIPDPAATEATVEVDSIAAQKSDIAVEQTEEQSSDARITPLLADIVNSSLKTG
jgi:hypothetical protein